MLLAGKKKTCLLFIVALYVVPACAILSGRSHAYANENYFLEKIQLMTSPYRILITMDQKSLYKVIQLDKKEIIIAFKDVAISDNFQKTGSAKPLIDRIRFKTHQNNVTALVVSTIREISSVDAVWLVDTNTLSVELHEPLMKHKTKASLKTKDRSKLVKSAVEKKRITEKNIEEESLPPVDISKETASNMEGTIDDILRVLISESCAKQETIRRAMELCSKEQWDDAVSLIDGFVADHVSDPCREPAIFLGSYSRYKNSIVQETSEYLDAIREIQDTTAFYPDSKYIPYLMTALGKLYVKLGNEAEARGYFKIVLDKYGQYSGTPEILFELALLEIKKKKYKEAILLYRRILSQYPYYVSLNDVKLELGKAFFEMNSFSKALVQLNDVIKMEPRKVYESPDLLLFVGNSYYHTGKYVEAREVLGQVYNLYPDLASADVVLTRIGDILVDEKQVEKAKEIFSYVTEKYPGTDGFIISSMRLAKFQENRTEKEHIYQSIINEYPEHPMANLARLRLAEIEYNAGEYEQSILSINDLLIENPRALMREAIYLKKESFKALFRELMAKKDYPGILSFYEKDKASVDRFDQVPEVFMLVGKSYYLGYLYSEAARLLEKAYKDYEDQKKPGDLLFLLGVSLQENKKNDEAIIYLNEYIKGYPEGEETPEIYRRIGRIQLAKNMDQKAMASYEKALRRTRDSNEKADILCEYGRVNLEKKHYKKAASFLYEAVNILNKTPEDHTALLLQAYRNIGEAEMHLRSYANAARAFAYAIEKTANEEEKVGLSFMLGESYQKSNKYKKAVEIYRGVAASGDAFWGKLAQEKLRGIELVEKLKNT